MANRSIYERQFNYFLLNFLCIALFFFYSCSQKRNPVIIRKNVKDSKVFPFDPDNEKDSITTNKLSSQFGNFKKSSKTYRLGAIMKFMGNQYWQLLADGMSTKASDLNATIDIQSAPNEADPKAQLKSMQAMVDRGYDAILISPQTNKNLDQAILDAEKKGILIVVVDDAIPSGTKHFVGPNQYQNGVSAAKFFIQNLKNGGEVALIRGIKGSYAVEHRSQGFIDTLKGSKIKIVEDETGEWDLQKTIEISNKILKMHKGLSGFYCNNDTMALGVVESVKINQVKNTIIIGTDGINLAKESILNEELTATIDSFPFVTGQYAVEVSLRLLNGQKIPKVVYTIQALVSRETLLNELKNEK